MPFFFVDIAHLYLSLNARVVGYARALPHVLAEPTGKVKSNAYEHRICPAHLIALIISELKFTRDLHPMQIVAESNEHTKTTFKP